MQKLVTQWRAGIFLGIKRTSGEVIVASDTGDIKWARAVKRVPIQERWCLQNLE